MLGLTTLGLVHTAISLVAVGAGAVALFRDGQITARNTLGKLYIWTTVLTCITSLGIFQHGGFGKPHALAIITLVTLLIAYVAAQGRFFGRAAPYVEVVSYSATMFFHLVPAVTETLTRLPAQAPVFASPEAQGLQAITGALLVALVIGATLQVRRMMKVRQVSGATRYA